MRRKIIGWLAAGLVVVSMSSFSSAQAAGSAGIYASCPNGAFVGIGGSGVVNIYFYGPSSTIYSTSRNLGGGSSTVVNSYAAASYSTVYVSGNATINSAGCR